jgi:hypothetical protein
MRRGTFILLLIGFTRPAMAASVRGRLDRPGPNRVRVPASGITVTLSSQRGRSTPSVTHQDGMYYLNMPAGAYNLEVWIRGTAGAPLVYPVQVREPYTDIPAILLP